MIKTFPLMPDVSTRTINERFRWAIDEGIRKWNMPEWGLVPTFDRRRNRPFVAPGERSMETETRYVYGLLVPNKRDTLVGHHVVGSGEIGVVFPSQYRNWDSASSYDRLRVHIYDLIVHDLCNRGHIRDTSQPSVVTV